MDTSEGERDFLGIRGYSLIYDIYGLLTKMKSKRARSIEDHIYNISYCYTDYAHLDEPCGLQSVCDTYQGTACECVMGYNNEEGSVC